jgi:DNA-binding transcriptional LysR family regulator
VRTFLAVLETESITKAAKLLGLPKSSVSRSIVALEADLSVQLFRRSRLKLTPTDVGLKFGEGARKAINMLGEAAREARDVLPGKPTTVRITAPADIGIVVLPEALAAIAAIAPEIQVELGLFPRRADLLTENWDFALRVGDPGSTVLVAKRVASLELGLYASADYLAKYGTPKKTADLRHHRWIEFAPPTGPHRASREAMALAEKCLVSTKVDDNQFVAAALEQGLGIGMMASLFVDKRSRLVRVMPELSLPGATLSLVYAKDRYRSQATKIVQDALIGWFKERASS